MGRILVRKEGCYDRRLSDNLAIEVERRYQTARVDSEVFLRPRGVQVDNLFLEWQAQLVERNVRAVRPCLSDKCKAGGRAWATVVRV